MSTTVFLAVLFAAFLHAGWNALVKTGGDKMRAMFILSTTQGLMGLAMALALPWPQGEVWLWLAASVLFHTFYKLLLVFAYERGDLSRVYPIARGAAPMLVLVVGMLFLADTVTALEYAGVVTIGLGIALMARGVFTSGESRRMLPFAAGSALATAGYSLVDGVGARVGGDATQYVAWLFFLDASVFAVISLVRAGPGVLSADRRAWGLGALAGGASLGAYWIAVWAMTVAPIALVAALRETSILFAVLLGALVFRERMDRAKLIAATAILAGVILTRI